MTDTVSETEVSFEVWQDGDMVAAADSLADAEHFMLVYGQDGPVEAKTAITARFLGFNVVTAMLAASPQGEKESDCVCVRRGDGPEGCGLCNETGAATHPASPQGEGSSADTKRSEPDALPGDLRERVDGLLARYFPEILKDERGNACGVSFVVREQRAELADAILALIQPERAG